MSQLSISITALKDIDLGNKYYKMPTYDNRELPLRVRVLIKKMIKRM